MATISGYDSSSIGVLFSSLNSGSTKTSAMFGTSDLLGISYSDYATIQNGSYTKLMKAYDRFKADGYTLKVYDAYRPIRVQRILFNIVKNKHWIANPDTTASNHNRGCAIDMSLIIDATGEEMEFPTPMHTFSEESARTCKTWSDAARANVDYITEVMAECGFNSIKSEWWHFSDTDSKKFMTTDIDLGSLTMLPKQEETNQ